MKTKVAAGQDPGFHSSYGADEDRLDMRRALLEGASDGKRGHEMSTGPTAGDENATWGSGAAGQLGGAVFIHVGASPTLGFSARPLAAPPPLCPAVPTLPRPAGPSVQPDALSAPRPSGFLAAARC